MASASVLTLVISGFISLLVAALSAFIAIRVARNNARVELEKIQRQVDAQQAVLERAKIAELRQRYLTPLRYYAQALSSRLAELEAKFRSPENDMVRGWFKEVKDHVTRDKVRLDYEAWCYYEGIFSVSTLYYTCSYFYYARSIRFNRPFSESRPAYAERLETFIMRVTQAFGPHLGDRGIWDTAQEAIGERFTKNDSPMTYAEMCSEHQADEPFRRALFFRPLDFYGWFDAGWTHQIKTPLDKLVEFLDRYDPQTYGVLLVTITAPAQGSTLATSTAPVTGTTTPGAAVTVESANTTTGASTFVANTTAAADGAFSTPVPVSFGSNVLTVSATAADGRSTGYSEVTVANEGIASTVLDVTNPVGNDNGPGTYRYPTSPDFVAGSFDLIRFQVLRDGTFAYLRVTLRTLVPTFGVIGGAQLLDVYVHVPGASATSTQAAFPSRNYTISSSGAWSQRVEVQGFAEPVWVNADGGTVETPLVFPNESNRTITIALPEAQFGTPTHGWGFTVVLTGQDGLSPDQARGFAATPQPFLFGVCASGGTSSICSVDPATVPKAMSVITPPGVSQADELDPTHGPVVIQPVTVP
jgi:C-terminal binding-module, SLH-like, of glucodextranase/Glucodextranase, domain B